jgi:hypothetical protein
MPYALVKVENLNATIRDLERLGVEIEDLKDAFSAIAREAAAVIERNTPKLTGRLSGDVRGNRAKSKAVVTAGRTSVPYAGAINYGWKARGIEPARYMQSADTQYASIAVQRLEAEINHQIRRKGLA